MVALRVPRSAAPRRLARSSRWGTTKIVSLPFAPALPRGSARDRDSGPPARTAAAVPGASAVVAAAAHPGAGRGLPAAVPAAGEQAALDGAHDVRSRHPQGPGLGAPRRRRAVHPEPADPDA